MLGQLERGELEFNVNYEGLDEFTRQLQRMTNRLALTMLLLAATIIALGLVMLVYHPPSWARYGGWLFGVGLSVCARLRRVADLGYLARRAGLSCGSPAKVPVALCAV